MDPRDFAKLNELEQNSHRQGGKGRGLRQTTSITQAGDLLAIGQSPGPGTMCTVFLATNNDPAYDNAEVAFVVQQYGREIYYSTQAISPADNAAYANLQFTASGVAADFWEIRLLLAGPALPAQPLNSSIVASGVENLASGGAPPPATGPWSYSPGPPSLIFATDATASVEAGGGTASGGESFAFGPGSGASAVGSASFGGGSSSGARAFAVNGGSIASGDDSFAWGGGTASGDDSMAGGGATASAQGAIAINGSLASFLGAFAFNGSTATAQGSIAWNGATSSAEGGIAFNEATTTGLGAFAVGPSSAASGQASVAFAGGDASGDSSLASGTGSQALVGDDVAFAGGLAAGGAAFATASPSQATGPSSFAACGGIAGGPYSAAVGNGSTANNYSDFAAGYLSIADSGGGAPGGAAAFGGSSALAAGAFAASGGGTASGLASTCFQANTASGYLSFCAGGNANLASGTESAILGGTANVASGADSVVVGGNNGLADSVTGFDTVLGGQNGQATGGYSTSIGGGIANQPNSVAIGAVAPIGIGAVAIGGTGFNQTFGPWAYQANTVLETADYAQLPSDLTIRGDATAGAMNVFLLAASSVPGQLVYVKKIDASPNAVTIQAAGADLIDGAASVPLLVQYAVVQLQSNGSGWDVLSTN